MTATRNYWDQFTYTASFLEPCEIVGVLEETAEPDARDPFPVLVIKMDNGRRVRINVTQKQLLWELGRRDPEPGDRLKITYLGPANKAAPGMSPTKEFTVAIRRPGSQDQGRPDGTSGQQPSENTPGPGENPP